MPEGLNNTYLYPPKKEGSSPPAYIRLVVLFFIKTFTEQQFPLSQNPSRSVFCTQPHNPRLLFFSHITSPSFVQCDRLWIESICSLLFFIFSGCRMAFAENTFTLILDNLLFSCFLFRLSPVSLFAETAFLFPFSPEMAQTYARQGGTFRSTDY